jgi:hypothetical protein
LREKAGKQRSYAHFFHAHNVIARNEKEIIHRSIAPHIEPDGQ